MQADPLLRPLLTLSDEKAAAPATEPPWPGRSHAAIRTSDSYSAFAEAAAAKSPELGRLMAGATLNVTHELGGYSTTTPDGAWVVARLLDDGTRLAAAQGQRGREAVHRGVGRALDGFLDALSSGSCPTTSYLGLRGISLGDPDAADVGVGVLRLLRPEEVRVFAAAATSWPAHGDELCLVLESEARWSVSGAPTRSTEAGKSTAIPRPELFPALLLLAGARDRRGHLRAPHIVWG